MKLFTFKRATYFMIVSIVFAVIISGCKKEEEETDSGTAPTIPPKSTMVMDAIDTSSTGGKLEGLYLLGKTDSINTYNNIWHAGGNVWFWNTIITINLVVPVTAFTESFNHEAVYQSDGSWKWSYTFNWWGTYTAELYGKISGNKVKWEMYITKANAYTKFKWFTGESDLALTAGSWSLNKDPNNSTPYIDIVWNRDATAGTSDIKYTNVIPGDAGNGGYITYGIVNDTSFDAFYDIFKIEDNNLINIKWNRNVGNGQVKDSLKFNDTDWHCWDSTLVDVVCQ